MGVPDFGRTQILSSQFDNAKRPFTRFLEMSYRFSQR